MSYRLYAAATSLAGPAFRLALAIRRARGKEHRARLGERFGRPGLARPEGALVWVHGASVGESLSVLPLIERLIEEQADLKVLVTTGTLTSAKLMEERLPDGAFHQFVPIDRRPEVRRFLAHWRPDLALWLESELWPNLLAETAGRGTPIVLINARMSRRSFARWRRQAGFARFVLTRFALCLAQSEGDAERLAVLGAPSPRCAGNLKFASPPLPAADGALESLRADIGGRPLWLASSTHPGEEEIIADAHESLGKRFSELLTIIVPRHPGRGQAIAGALAKRGLGVGLRSAGDGIAAGTAVYVADTMGELGLFYRLAGVVFIGGSLVPHGGQNPIEPAQLDSAILHGPHMMNFQPIVAALTKERAAQEVTDAASVAEAVGNLLADSGERRRRALAAGKVAASEAGVLERYLEALAPYLASLPLIPT
ncbi:MAG: 3-deoxy-D-manno-octulosonic acid transferase [Alphaproteobacteria bacterium]